MTRIALRSHDRDDPHWGDIDQENPHDLLEYVIRYARGARRYGPSDPRRAAAKADTQDAQLIQLWLEWQLMHTDHNLIEAMGDLGLTLTQIGSRLGITTRKGVQNRLNRRRALFGDVKRPDAALGRDAHHVTHPTPAGDPRAGWVATHRAELAAVVAKLLACYNLADEDAATSLLMLRTSWTTDEWTPGTMTVLGWAVDELRVSAPVLRLDPKHRAFAAIKTADRLRMEYTNTVAN